MSATKLPAGFDFFAPRKPKKPVEAPVAAAKATAPPPKKSKIVEDGDEVEESKMVVSEPEATSSAPGKSSSANEAAGGSSVEIKPWKLDKPISSSVNSSVAEEDEYDEEEEMKSQFEPLGGRSKRKRENGVDGVDGKANGGDGNAQEDDDEEDETLGDEEHKFQREQEEEKAILESAKNLATPEVRELQKLFAIWEVGKPVPYLALARAFREIHQTRSKLRHIAVIREFFRTVLERTPEQLVPCIYLATNKLAPQFEGIELGIGDMIMQKAIMEATGKSLKTLKADYKKLGDLGLVAQESIRTIRTLVAPKPLTVMSVFENLHAIAAERGNASQKKKQDRIRSLLVACKEYESMYIIKALQGKMRINLGPKSVIAGLAHALAFHESRSGNPPEELLGKSNKLVRAAFARRPDWSFVVAAALKNGLARLPETCQLTIGVPVEPMLAQPTNGVEAILHRLQGHDTFTAEYKYDGERAQVHLLPNGTIKIYSRNLEDNTGRFPDIIKRLPNCYVDPDTTQSFILDCEAVAYDLQSDKILPYQVLSTRSRKDVNIDSIKVQVCLYVFDILYLNGESLLDNSLKERREKLHEKFKTVPGETHFATHREFENSEELEAFLTESIDNQCEGLMIKTWNSSAQYEPARRSPLWLKFKKDYKEGLADSVDLVPIGAWYGKGKRTGVFGAYLLACYNDDTEEYQSACKIGTGFSDVQLQELTTSMKEHICDERSYYSTGDALRPDVWFDPVAVWEIRAADLSLSPQHKAAFGLVTATRGIGLRFPRFLRIRTDKSPEQATNADQIADLYNGQKIHTGPKASFADDGED